MITLDYFLPGITIGASGARQPVDISIKINYRSAREHKYAQIRRKQNKRERKKNITTLLGKSEIIKFIYEFKILIY